MKGGVEGAKWEKKRRRKRDLFTPFFLHFTSVYCLSNYRLEIGREGEKVKRPQERDSYYPKLDSQEIAGMGKK